MRVAVFGGASPRPGEPAYQDAQRLGSLLARRGHTVLTGGYIGVMEAVSRGANEAGGHVIGVTCNEIEQWRNSTANPWVKEEIKFETLRERMYALVDGCDAAVVMPGGVGTLAELAVTWNEQIINHRLQFPVILVGPGWEEIIHSFSTIFEKYIHTQDLALLRVVPDVEAVISTLESINPD